MLTVANRNQFPQKQQLPPQKDYHAAEWGPAKLALIVHRRQNSCLSENPCCCEPKSFYFGSFSLDDPDCCRYNNNTSMFNSLQCRDNAPDSHSENCVCDCVVHSEFLHVSDKKRQSEKDGKQEGSQGVICSEHVMSIHLHLPSIIWYFCKHPQPVISGHP